MNTLQQSQGCKAVSDMINVSICDGKYTIIQDASGRTNVLRYGESWRDATGDNVVLGAAYEICKLQSRIKKLEAAVKAYQHVYTPDGHVAPHDCFATGPRLGDSIQDLIVCPGCWAEKKAKEAKL